MEGHCVGSWCISMKQGPSRMDKSMPLRWIIFALCNCHLSASCFGLLAFWKFTFHCLSYLIYAFGMYRSYKIITKCFLVFVLFVCLFIKSGRASNVLVTLLSLPLGSIGRFHSPRPPSSPSW